MNEMSIKLVILACLFCCTLKAEPVIYLYGADADKAYRLTNSNDFDQEMIRSCPENTTSSKTPGLKSAAGLFLSVVCVDGVSIEELKIAELKNGILEHLSRKEYTLILLVDDYNKNLTVEAIKNLDYTVGEKSILKFNTTTQRQEVISGTIWLDPKAIGDITGKDYYSPIEILVVGESEFHSDRINEDELKWLKFIAYSSKYAGCEIDDSHKEIIYKFGQRLFEYKNKTRLQLMSALENFHTSMIFSSKKSSYTNYDSVVTNFLTDMAKGLGDELLSKLPGYKITIGAVVNAIDNVIEEKKRAKKAGQSFEMGRWIIEMRTRLSDCDDEDLCPTYSESYKKKLIQQVCNIPKGVERNRTIIFMGNSGIDKSPKKTKFYTKTIFERWISSHDSELRKVDKSLVPLVMKSLKLSDFTTPLVLGFYEKASGFIDIIVDEKTQKVMEINIIAPGFGDKAESAMGELPFKIRDYKVFKRVCIFRKPTISRLPKYFCTVYNESNKMFAEPVKDSDKKIALRNIPSQYLNYQKFGDF